MDSSGFFSSIGSFTYRFKKTIILLWSILLVVLGYYAFQLPSVLSGSGFDMEGSYKEVQDMLQDEFDLPDSTIILVFEKGKGQDQAFKSYIKKTLAKMEGIKGLEKVVSPYEQEGMIKGDTAYALLHFNRNFDEMKEQIKQVRTSATDQAGMSVMVTGQPLINEDMSTASQEDLKQAELIGLPFALVTLLLAFGGVVAAFIPLIVGVVSVLTTMGVLYFLGLELNMSIFLLNVVPMIGLALSIDFALIFVSRYREELNHRNVADAVETAVATAGRSIVFSGLCVFLGMAGMLIINIDIFQTVAIGGMAVVVISVLSALTFLPALLSLLGTRINRLMIFKEKKNQQSRWYGFAKFVMDHPIVMSLLVLAILIVSLLPIKGMILTIPQADSLPDGYETRVAYERYEDTFIEKDTTDVFIIAETGKDLLEREQLLKVEKLIEEVEKEKLVKRTQSIFSAAGNVSAEQFLQMLETPQGKPKLQPLLEQLTDENKTLITVTLDADGNSEAAKDWVREWETKDTEVLIKIGGFAKFNQEIFDEIYSKVPWGMAIVLGSTFIILMLAFHSIIIPLKAIIMNLMSLGATFGILVWLFEEGHLGIEPTTIALMIPVFIFGIVFGLSMDYEVFLISRIHEEYLKTRDNHVATLEGLTATSKVITSAAAIMIVVTGAFAFTGVIPVKQMGVGTALAIFIDATLVRMILVPALMKLLGDWNWWYPFKTKIKLHS